MDNRNTRTSWTPSEPWSSLSPVSASATCLTKCTGTVVQSSFTILLSYQPCGVHDTSPPFSLVLISNRLDLLFYLLAIFRVKYLTYNSLRNNTTVHLLPFSSSVILRFKPPCMYVLNDSVTILATPCLHNMIITHLLFSLRICYLTCYYLASSHFGMNIFIPALQGVHGVDNDGCDTHQHDRLLRVYPLLLLQPLSQSVHLCLPVWSHAPFLDPADWISTTSCHQETESSASNKDRANTSSFCIRIPQSGRQRATGTCVHTVISAGLYLSGSVGLTSVTVNYL